MGLMEFMELIDSGDFIDPMDLLGFTQMMQLMPTRPKNCKATISGYHNTQFSGDAGHFLKFRQNEKKTNVDASQKLQSEN